MSKSSSKHQIKLLNSKLENQPKYIFYLCMDKRYTRPEAHN